MRLLTRRSWLCGAVAYAFSGARAQAPAGKVAKPNPRGPLRSEFVRFADPLTELPVVRLTALSSAAVMPGPGSHFISTRSRFLVFSSDRNGALALYRMDLRSSAVQQLAEAAKLDAKSVTLDAAEKHVFFLDGGELRQSTLGRRETVTVAENVSAFALSTAGADPVFIREGKLQHLSGILARVLADDAAGPCLVSPDGTRCLFTRNAGPDREFWSAALGGSKPQLAAKGLVSFPFWSADSSRILFLRQLESGTSEIRESSLAGDERLVSRTSRFGSFSPNHDASVFVGASASKAQPLIALLLRTGQRELPLCEIHAGEAESATPVFSPDNRRVYFQSEREGKPALYSINTEELVEAAF